MENLAGPQLTTVVSTLPAVADPREDKADDKVDSGLWIGHSCERGPR